MADTEGWGEQPDVHGEDHHYRAVDFVHPFLLGDRKQQRPEQHDGRDAPSTLPRMTKATMLTARKVGIPLGRPVMNVARTDEKLNCVSAQAMPVAVPMVRRIAPDRTAVITNTGERRRHPAGTDVDRDRDQHARPSGRGQARRAAGRIARTRNPPLGIIAVWWGWARLTDLTLGASLMQPEYE